MPPARYAAAPADHLLKAPLDGLTAVYHRASGQTHVLVEPAPALLDALDAEPLTLEALMLALGFDADDHQTAEGLKAHLETLLAAGLVWHA